MLSLSAAESVKEVCVCVHVYVRVWQDRNLLNKVFFIFILEVETKEGIAVKKKLAEVLRALKWI